MGISAHPKKETCPICGTPSLEYGFRASPLDYSSQQEFLIWTCTRCGHGMTEGASENKGSESSLYEQGNYDLQENIGHRVAAPLLLFLERTKFNYLRDLNRVGECILEIGCGKGRFLEYARKMGLNVYGVEPSSRSSGFAKLRLGESAVFKADLESIDEIKELSGVFHAIILWHVLEHFPDPDAAMEKIRKRIAPGGVVLIAVPNFGSYQAKMGRQDWYHLDPPRHLHHFTSHSLQTLLDRHGLRVEQRYFNSFYQDYLGEMLTLSNRFSPDKNVLLNLMRLNPCYLRKRGKKRLMFVAVVTSFLTLISAVPAFIWTWITEKKGRSGTMVFVARPLNSPK